jgi:diguanylate cyclase (GGDEF)-like protein
MEQDFAAISRPTNVQHSETATTANGILSRNDKLVAADAVLQSWLGDRKLSELLPEYDNFEPQLAFQSTLHRVGELPCTANLAITQLDGELGEFMLLRIDIASPMSTLHLDAVTGLPDRRALESQRQLWRNEAKTDAIPHALLFMDLVGFKQINDLHGHALGDQVLQALAERWQHSLRHGDLIVRYGGDEFVVLLRGVDSAKSAKPIIERLKKITEQPLELEAQLLEVKVTIGLALASDLSVELEALLAEADQAMYAAKREG